MCRRHLLNDQQIAEMPTGQFGRKAVLFGYPIGQAYVHEGRHMRPPGSKLLLRRQITGRES